MSFFPILEANNIEGLLVLFSFHSFIYSFLVGTQIFFKNIFLPYLREKFGIPLPQKYNKHVQLILTCDLEFFSGLVPPQIDFYLFIYFAFPIRHVWELS
jgi:hypothetical protein